MKSEVQVLQGPPTIPAAHGHAGWSSMPALLAALPGSCHPRASPSGGRVLQARRGGLDQLVQGGREGGIPRSHDVLVTEGRSRGAMPNPDHQIAGAGGGADQYLDGQLEELYGEVRTGRFTTI